MDQLDELLSSLATADGLIIDQLRELEVVSADLPLIEPNQGETVLESNCVIPV